ncbi:MAG: LamG-like jellyroll fold domain-containing protein [Planctomycetota bacterium]|jgi:hypothetical protein
MSKKLFCFVALVLLLGVVEGPAFATDYHIDPVSGSDSTGDGSLANPWETFANIQYYYSSGYRPAGWVNLQPGDTIYLMNGVHNTVLHPGGPGGPDDGGSQIAVWRTKHGDSNNWFRIKAYPGHNPIIDGQNTAIGIKIYQSSYWEVEAVEVRNCYGRGIYISEDTAVKVHDVHIHDTDGWDDDNLAGLYLLASTDVEVYNSVFNDNYDRTCENTGGQATANSTNMVLFSNSGDIIIYDCDFYQSLPLTDSKSGGGLKYKHASPDPASTFQVYNCTFRNHKFFAFLTASGNTHFHHNLIDGGYNIHSLDSGGPCHQINQTFEYNTHYNTKGMTLVPTINWRNAEFPDDPKNIQFKNNIIYDDGSYDAFTGIITVGTYMTDELFNIIVPELFFGNNCYYNPSEACQFNIGSINGGSYGVLGGVYSLSQWQSTYGYDTNSIEADPLFVDAANDDFHLQGGSPAAGMGMYAGTGPQPPGQASNPSPADTATSVSTTADLSWTAGSGATSHDVYFGTSSPGTFQGNQTAMTFDTGTMSNSTTYYWRIDEVNAQGTTTGNVWSFTTEAVPSPPGQASNPNPANSATDIAVTADLSWTTGSGAASHDVYFGTSSPGAFQGNQTADTYDTGTMSNNTTYYWRIDEVNSAGTTTGNLWSFTTIVAPPAQATSPSPADSATGVSTTADLSWTTGSGATSHDVYFGTSSPGSFQGNQTANTFDTGTMDNDTTYYWRIDEINAGGTTTGSVWSFTTIVAAPSQASSPSPADSATGVSITADLSWTAASGATSHDVYFGTSSPGAFQGNQTATTFDTGTMNNNTTYYWRIDEINAGGTTTGSVWSFTTIVAAPTQATNPGPADSATDIAVGTDLSWTAGSGATSHDVYFGTSSPGSFQGNQTTTTFDTGTMDNDTTYYWRIDEINAGGTTTGNVWSFTTITSGQPVTEEFGDAVNTDYPGTVNDTWTDAGGDGDDNYSSATTLNTYTWPADTVANTTIIKWDLSAIPNDAAVTEATLYLYQFNAGGDTSYDIGVHKIINVNPVISACTWNTYDGTNSWTGGADGGQADTAAAEDTPALNSTNNEYKTWSVTGMVDDWVSTPANNYGMLVNSDDVASVDSFRFFASTEVADASTRPKLIVTYIAGSPGLATNPDPNDSAADVSTSAILSWTAGSAATSHDVYFGTTSPASFQGNQTETTFDPGTLSYDITYYWRIDEINAAGTTTGNLWSFTTEAAPQTPGQPTNPSPADSATNVEVDADLSWTAGTGSTSSDVYFGTSSPGSFQGNQTETSFDPGTMANDTTYYWRIDEINADGTTTGNVWSFTTIVAAPSQATNPGPADSATDVDINTDLSWTAGSGSTSSDVYFGTTSPGAFQSNQTATTFEPGTMANNTTYYWRIDEINAGGTTTGNVWTFTTIIAAPSQATNPSPADSATDVDIDADLSWTAGSDSTSSDVYFGTTSPGTFQANQTATTFETGTMANDTTYYWRIDEINAAGTTTGNVWSFTTIVAAPGAAGNPSPADSATDVDIDADLSWTPGTGSTSSDVYFGTTSPGAFQGNQTETTFEPGTLNNSTTYYWRIDEKNAGGTTTGVVWSFTTIEAPPGQANNPAPADSATNVNIDADLSWTAGTGATSHDVYFGTTSPGTFQANQTATTFEPGTMANDTTYYWRIDELSVGGTTTGVVWSFTTVVSTGDEIIGWWEMDDASGGTTVDSTPYGNDGTLVGSVAWTDDAQRGWCLDFSGDDNYVTIPNESFFDLTGNMTVMAWMRASYVDWRNFPTIIAKGKDGNGGWALQKASRDNAMSFYVDVSGMPWDGIKAGVGIFDNQWHHVAGVYDGSDAYIYIDGGLDSNSVACSGNMATNDWPVYIGENSKTLLDEATNAREWEGLIDDVRVYNYDLTQTEINDIYTGGPTPPGQAANPSPADSATDVSIDADLSWTAGTDSTSSDVYFGTTSPGAFQGNQTVTTFEPGTMANDTTYYWRIDEINAAGTTTGLVWNFTTESAPAFLPWTDGFESGDLVTGGWTTSGNASASNKAEYTGTYGAAIKGTAWMEKAISTAGFTAIHVLYVGEYLYVEYHDGTQWNVLEATQATSWASQDKTCGSGADNNADFKIRFRLNASNANEYAYIDDVEITGTSQ